MSFWPKTVDKVKGDAEKVAAVQEIIASEPEMNIGIEKFEFARKEKQPGAGRKEFVDYRGYLLAPEDGWYALAIVGGQQVTIDEYDLFNFNGSLQQSYIPLAKGLHTFSHVANASQDGYIRFSWMPLDGKRVLPEGKTDEDFKGTTRWQCYRPLPGSLFYKK